MIGGCERWLIRFDCSSVFKFQSCSLHLLSTDKNLWRGNFHSRVFLQSEGLTKPPHLWVWVRNKLIRWVDFLFCQFFSFHVNWLINQHLCLFEVEYVVLFWCAYDANFIGHQLCNWLNPAAVVWGTFRGCRSLIALILQRQSFSLFSFPHCYTCCVHATSTVKVTLGNWSNLALNYKANGITSTQQCLFLRRLNPNVMLFIRFVLSKLSRNHFTSASIPRDIADLSASHVCFTVDHFNPTLKTSHFWKKCFGCGSVILFPIAIYFIKTNKADTK